MYKNCWCRYCGIIISCHMTCVVSKCILVDIHNQQGMVGKNWRCQLVSIMVPRVDKGTRAISHSVTVQYHIMSKYYCLAFWFDSEVWKKRKWSQFKILFPCPTILTLRKEKIFLWKKTVWIFLCQMKFYFSVWNNVLKKLCIHTIIVHLCRIIQLRTGILLP